MLTIDELAQRRHAERQREREATDLASRTSQALAAQEAQLHAVLEAFPGMVAWSNDQGIYQYANRNSTSLYGLEPAQVIGRSLAEVIGPERAAKTFARRKHVVAGGHPVTFERHLTHPHMGAPVDLLVTHFVLPPHTAGGAPSFCQFAMDIGDRSAPRRRSSPRATWPSAPAAPRASSSRA